MINFTVEKDWVTASGLRAVVVNDTHRCGYVAVPKGHPAFKKDYGDLQIDAPGGLTYARGTNENYPVAATEVWWLGFDCAHWDDMQNPKSLQYCENECEAIAKQLAEMK